MRSVEGYFKAKKHWEKRQCVLVSVYRFSMTCPENGLTNAAKGEKDTCHVATGRIFQTKGTIGAP